jgi:hypothetical protein
MTKGLYVFLKNSFGSASLLYLNLSSDYVNALLRTRGTADVVSSDPNLAAYGLLSKLGRQMTYAMFLKDPTADFDTFLSALINMCLWQQLSLNGGYHVTEAKFYEIFSSAAKDRSGSSSKTSNNKCGLERYYEGFRNDRMSALIHPFKNASAHSMYNFGSLGNFHFLYRKVCEPHLFGSPVVAGTFSPTPSSIFSITGM